MVFAGDVVGPEERRSDDGALSGSRAVRDFPAGVHFSAVSDRAADLYPVGVLPL